MDRRDSNHQACRRLLQSFNEAKVIPGPVLPEVDYLVNARGNPRAMLALLDDILAGAFRVEELRLEDYERIRELCERYADSDIGFVDAAVLAVVERLGEPKLATLDQRHFSMMRPRHVDSLLLLPER